MAHYTCSQVGHCNFLSCRSFLLSFYFNSIFRNAYLFLIFLVQVFPNMGSRNHLNGSDALGLTKVGQSHPSTNRWRQVGCEEKKTAVQAEMERMSKLPANSNYATHRMRVLNKILHLMSTQVRMLYNHIVKGYLVDIRLFKCVTGAIIGKMFTCGTWDVGKMDRCPLSWSLALNSLGPALWYARIIFPTSHCSQLDLHRYYISCIMML